MLRVCLCPASIAWIRKHLMKSARTQFNKLIKKNFIPGSGGRMGRMGTKRKFSPKQLAAQRLFAKRARAGTLRHGRRRRRRR